MIIDKVCSKSITIESRSRWLSVNLEFGETIQMTPYVFLSGREIAYLIDLIREVLEDHVLSMKTEDSFDDMLNTIDKIKNITIKNDARYWNRFYYD